MSDLTKIEWTDRSGAEQLCRGSVHRSVSTTHPAILAAGRDD